MDFRARIERVAGRLDDCGIDGLLVTNPTNVRYLTGFSGTNGQVLVSQESAVFFSDPRYEARAAAIVQGAEVAIYRSRLTELLPARLEQTKIGRLGIEARSMTIADRDELDERLPGIDLVSTKNAVEDLRRSKEPDEIEVIREAVRVADEAFEWVLGRLSVGATEREIALDVDVHMRKAGADGVSFDPIIGSGPLSAHIHHSPSDRAFEKGDFVLLDIGCKWQGYCSDLTRTVVLGPASDEQREQYELVLAAQGRGIQAATIGSPVGDVDAAARGLIEAAGHGEAFGHPLGHGVGLDIHEAPRLHAISDERLVDGDVVTIEPGVYHPGFGGVRIEDCILVTARGPQVLGSAPKDTLIEL